MLKHEINCRLANFFLTNSKLALISVLYNLFYNFYFFFSNLFHLQIPQQQDKRRSKSVIFV